MEGLAIVLFYITLVGVIVNIGLIIYSIIKKDFKYRPKKLGRVLIVFIVAFIGSTIFYGTVQSPESKEKYEASQKAKEEEKNQKELAETEKKAEDEKLKQEYQQAKEYSETKTESEPKEDIQVEVKEEDPKADDRFTIKADENTTAAVDELYYKAKEHASTATEDDLKEAIKFISDNYNNYWTNNDTMRKTMYYGSFLYNAKKEKAKENQKGIDFIICELGSDTQQAVKYVYRNIEKVEDTSTQSNLNQIKKGLDKISDKYKE